MIHIFASFELDERLYQLRRAAKAIKIEPKVFDVLAYLVHHRDRVVSKGDLIEKLWPGQVVTESALTRCIGAARKAVGDNGVRQRIIKTQHGRGYRFATAVTKRADEPPDGAAPGPGDRDLRFRSSPPPAVVASEQAPAPPLPDRPSIAVLPFTNMSSDPEQEHFSDGMTEDLITDLSRLSGLFVIARHSVFAYKGMSVKVEQVSRELGVQYVLEGYPETPSCLQA